MIRTIEWTESAVVVLDQRLLPGQEVYRSCNHHTQVADAIRSMAVRGAPLIGIAAAMGIALGMKTAEPKDLEDMDTLFERICTDMRATRPTGMNLFWAVQRMKSVYDAHRASGIQAVSAALVQEALRMYSEDIESNRRIGYFGQQLIPDPARILTHCNAGALATAGYGTALGIVRAAVEAGKQVHVFADETRPLLQGARLTAWELEKDRIPVTVITDNMAGYFLKCGNIDCVIVGADRIAANGDVANKIGTYSISVVAKENGVPFYVAAPLSTLDLSIPDGSCIPIEERDPDEVRKVQGVMITPADAKAANPAFDITPNRYVHAIITERGIARPPLQESLSKLVQ